MILVLHTIEIKLYGNKNFNSWNNRNNLVNKSFKNK